MKKTMIISYLFLVAFAGSLFANEVNIFSARHYDSDVQLYEKFTAKTGIKVNVVSGKSGALEKRIIEEGADSQADLYITADAGRLGAFEANLQGGLTSAAIKSAVPSNFRTSKWTGIAKRARIVYFAPERVSGAELAGLTYESLADPKWKGRLVIRASNNIYNQSLVASLIKNNGKGKIADWSKGMVSNMARSPKGNDRAQILAVAAGEADIAVANTYYLALMLSGKKGLVIGYGDVGKGSAASLAQEGMIVSVVESDPICAMQACMDGFAVVSCYKDGVVTRKPEDINMQVMGDIDLVVTTTGNVNVCDSAMLTTLKNTAVVCNIGHFDNEIDTAFLRDEFYWDEIKPQVHRIFRDTKPDGTPDLSSKNYIILLAEGRLVNLGNATGHPSRIMDGSFANQVLAQIHLFKQGFANINDEDRKAEMITVEVLPKKLDEEVASLMVAGFGGVVTKLTKDQADYINVPQEGPFKEESYKY